MSKLHATIGVSSPVVPNNQDIFDFEHCPFVTTVFDVNVFYGVSHFWAGVSRKLKDIKVTYPPAGINRKTNRRTEPEKTSIEI